jgi:hypothetical protein
LFFNVTSRIDKQDTTFPWILHLCCGRHATREVLPPAYRLEEPAFLPHTLSTVLPTFVKIISQKAPAVFVVVAVGTEVFPVGTIRWVVVRVAVSVVDRQEVPLIRLEFTTALGADEAMNPQ